MLWLGLWSPDPKVTPANVNPAPIARCAPIAQLAEAADLKKSAQCRFESDWGGTHH